MLKFINPTPSHPIGSWQRVADKDKIFAVGISIVIVATAVMYLIIN